MIKKLLTLVFVSIYLLSCQQQPDFEIATSPLDGGRYFIESCLQGEFKKAKFYLISDSANQGHFEQITKNYYTLDKEGRQQLRLASIQINEISAIDSSNSVINYQNSFEKVAHKLKVIQTKEGWKVDLKYSYTPEL
ncbi:MAG: hypothetical protein NTW92_05925 [Bacteroidetes bacterium]|nr:hypothetical protein [Bacteroidota bacterium]